MAIIKCPECGKDVSDKAVSCPACGYPIASKIPNGDIQIKIGILKAKNKLQTGQMVLLWNRLRYSYNFLNSKLTHYYIWVIIMIVL